MFCHKLIAQPLRRHLIPTIQSVRHLAAEPAPNPGHCDSNNTGAAQRPEIAVTTTTINGIKVVSARTVNHQHAHPLARVAIAFRAGSRYERPVGPGGSGSTVGAAHFLRRCVGLKSATGSAFLSTRTGQQYGVALFVRGDRELLTVTAAFRPGALCEAMSCLRQAATEPLFLPWEVDDVRKVVQHDCRTLDDCGRSVELLHLAAFRRGLGRAIMCPEYRWRAVCPRELHAFYQETCTADRCTVGALNVDADTLQRFVESLRLPGAVAGGDAGGGGCTGGVASTFHNDVRRLHTGSRWSHIAVGAEAGACSGGDGNARKNALSLAVVRNALGAGPVGEYTSTMAHETGILPAAIAEACGPQALFRCEALHASYSDGGLIGFQLTAEPHDVAAALRAAVGAMRQGGDKLTEDDVRRGKAKVQAAILYELESEQRLLDDMVAQTLLHGQWTSAQDLRAEVDALPVSEVQGMLQKCTCELAMAAVGDLDQVPYLDEIN